VRTAIAELDLQRATSLDEALRIRREDGRTPLAGATDLYVELNFGTLRPRRFIDLWALDELRQIRMADNTLVLGAMLSWTALIRSALVAERLPMLIEAARLVGGVQIQNRGTLGGNIANGSPAADSLPVLAAVDAVVVLQSLDGQRRIPIGQFYTGYRATVLRADELIVAVEVPAVNGEQFFRKVGTRAALAISKIVMAGVRGPEPKIAFGSVAPTVVRVPETERALAEGAHIEDAVRILAREIAPIDDLRSTAAYRRLVAGNLLRRFWTA
jgi:CO/xanthine dehydrogenase FAD-binding subunit